MDGNKSLKTPLLALTLALLAGSVAPALAGSAVEAPRTQVSAAEVAAALPRFEPSSEVFAQDLVQVEAEIEMAEITAGEPADEPAARDLGAGVASWYGSKFAGRKTANGERFDPEELTAAHRTLPFGSKVRVTRGGKSVVVRINDRGPFHGNRMIDLSQAAAAELGLVRAGSGRVELALLDS